MDGSDLNTDIHEQVPPACPVMGRPIRRPELLIRCHYRMAGLLLTGQVMRSCINTSVLRVLVVGHSIFSTAGCSVGFISHHFVLISGTDITTTAGKRDKVEMDEPELDLSGI